MTFHQKTNPKPTLTWTKDGVRISASSEISESDDDDGSTDSEDSEPVSEKIRVITGRQVLFYSTRLPLLSGTLREKFL